MIPLVSSKFKFRVKHILKVCDYQEHDSLLNERSFQWSLVILIISLSTTTNGCLVFVYVVFCILCIWLDGFWFFGFGVCSFVFFGFGVLPDSSVLTCSGSAVILRYYLSRASPLWFAVFLLWTLLSLRLGFLPPPDASLPSPFLSSCLFSIAHLLGHTSFPFWCAGSRGHSSFASFVQPTPSLQCSSAHLAFCWFFLLLPSAAVLGFLVPPFSLLFFTSSSEFSAFFLPGPGLVRLCPVFPFLLPPLLFSLSLLFCPSVIFGLFSFGCLFVVSSSAFVGLCVWFRFCPALLLLFLPHSVCLS